MAEVSHKCSEWGGSSNTSSLVMGFQEIDRLVQNGVEDADKTLIEYEKTHIFHLWVCPKCGSYQFPESEPDGSETTPECHCNFLSYEDGIEMEKVMVERMD